MVFIVICSATDICALYIVLLLGVYNFVYKMCKCVLMCILGLNLLFNSVLSNAKKPQETPHRCGISRNTKELPWNSWPMITVYIFDPLCSEIALVYPSTEIQF